MAKFLAERDRACGNRQVDEEEHGLTRAIVGFMAGAGDLSAQLKVVLGQALRGIVGPQRKHAPRKAGQVAHLVLQEAAFPLGDVRQPPAGLADQVSLDCLEITLPFSICNLFSNLY